MPINTEKALTEQEMAQVQEIAQRGGDAVFAFYCLQQKGNLALFEESERLTQLYEDREQAILRY